MNSQLSESQSDTLSNWVILAHIVTLLHKNKVHYIITSAYKYALSKKLVNGKNRKKYNKWIWAHNKPFQYKDNLDFDYLKILSKEN